MEPQVDYVLPEVEEAAKLWEVVRDCLDGQQAVKKRTVRYVPQPNPADTSDENRLRYVAYLTRGVFVNFTQRTLSGMTGEVFAKDAQARLPKNLEILLQDVDGGAVTLDQQAKQTLADVISVGRCGLLTDFPTRDGPTSRADALAGKVRPTIQFYFAEQIINWRVTVIDSRRVLTMVVLKESFVIEDDGFKAVMGDQWRVLRLNDAGEYTVTLYQKGLTGTIVKFGETITPKKADGKSFDYIPFEFVGAQNNDPGIDQVPLLDLANLNIAHFRNSCDFEEMVYQLGQPTPVFAGLTKDWVDTVLGGKVIMGSNMAISLPEGGTAELLQLQESQLAMTAMEHKERQAVALGARLVQSSEVQRTAKEAGLEDASETSLLLSSAKNVNSAYARALASAALYAGAPTQVDGKSIAYELNTDFDILRLDPAARAQLLSEWQRGIITFSEYRNILKRAGIATLDDDDAKDEIMEDAANLAATLGIDPTVQNDGSTPADKNAPPAKPGAPVNSNKQNPKPKKVAKQAGK